MQAGLFVLHGETLRHCLAYASLMIPITHLGIIASNIQVFWFPHQQVGCSLPAARSW